MEITNVGSQIVRANENVIFTDIDVPGCNSIIYKPGSGLVILRGMCSKQPRARFHVTYAGNLKADPAATVTGATLLQLAVAINGEVIPSSTMTVTVSDTVSTFNIGTELFVDVPTCCCQTLSIKNISAIAVDSINSNLIIERVA